MVTYLLFNLFGLSNNDLFDNGLIFGRDSAVAVGRLTVLANGVNHLDSLGNVAEAGVLTV